MLVYHFIFDHVKENERKRGLGGGEKWDFLYYPDNGLEGIIRNLVQGDP